MKLSDIFEIKYGVNLELINCDIDEENGIPFVARTCENNGVVAKVKKINGIFPNPAGSLSCAGGGSVLSTFLQEKEYYSGRDLYVLIPKNKNMSKEEKLYYCTLITQNKYRYSYGRQANKTLKDIEIPNSIPACIYNYDLEKIKFLYKTIISPTQGKNILNINNWKKFTFADIFEIKRGKRLKSEDRIPGNIKYFSASESNNGLTDYISNPLFIEKKSLIYTTFGDCYYIENCFTASDEISILKHKKLNKYNGLFLATIINQNKYKYRFGRKAFQNKFIDETILLPVNGDEKVDWEFMENYIRSLPYSDKI